jgi:hypothetical protein
MVNVLKRPARKAPQLLVVPERDRVERALRANFAGPVRLVALELERNETQQFGEVLEMVVVVMKPAPDHTVRLTVRHVMPGGEPNVRHLIGGAEVLGQRISQEFRRRYGNWDAPVLEDEF